MGETELREALRKLDRVEMFEDGDGESWGYWVAANDIDAALASIPAEPEQDFTGHQRAYPGTVGPLGWQARAIPAEPEQADEGAGLDVERLARTLHEDDDGSLGTVEAYRAEAVRLAREYARLAPARDDTR